MQRSEFEKKPIQDHWGKMIIVTGEPGNRSDMVAGWITENNPRNFVPVGWTINPVWGNSTFMHSWNWVGINPKRSEVQQRQEIKSIIRDIFAEQYRPDARWAVTKSHCTSTTLIDFIPEELREHFVILDIIVEDFESRAQVDWEAFVKNILRLFSSNTQSDHDLARKNLLNNLAGVVDTAGKNDLELLKAKYEFMQLTIRNKSIPRKDWYSDSDPTLPVKTVTLDYQQLMSSRGPWMLSDALDISHWCMGQWWEQPRCE
jgi:hypothetical protein